MEDHVQTVVSTMEAIQQNWEYILAIVLAIIAGIDKVAMVCIKTLKNIIDEWKNNFPKKEKDPFGFKGDLK